MLIGFEQLSLPGGIAVPVKRKMDIARVTVRCGVRISERRRCLCLLAFFCVPVSVVFTESFPVSLRIQCPLQKSGHVPACFSQLAVHIFLGNIFMFFLGGSF